LLQVCSDTSCQRPPPSFGAAVQQQLPPLPQARPAWTVRLNRATRWRPAHPAELFTDGELAVDTVVVVLEVVVVAGAGATPRQTGVLKMFLRPVACVLKWILGFQKE